MSRTISHPELMSVGPDEVVVTFVTEAERRVTTRCGDHEVSTTGPYHHAHITGLEPELEYDLAIEDATPDRWLPARVRTLSRPSGRLLARIATANDTHFGEIECGRTGDPATDAIGPILRSGPDEPPYPEVMNKAVVAEMQAFDPDAVIVKGDLTDRGLPDQYMSFLRTYGALGARMHHVRGNHDAKTDPELAREGAPYVVDVNGVTLAVLDTTVPGSVGGALPAAQLGWLHEIASSRTGLVFVFAHHPAANPNPDYGIEPADTVALVDVVDRHENIVGYFAGHTHTNVVQRLTSARTVPFVEVACTKDYPGAWAEYRVYEGGFTQVMRRVAASRARAWSERARTMIQGVYRDLVLGPIDARCFSSRF